MKPDPKKRSGSLLSNDDTERKFSMLTLILIALGFFALTVAFFWNLAIIQAWTRDPRAKVAALGSLAACIVVLSNPIAFAGVEKAYGLGGAWSSPFVAHIPTASDFWAFCVEFFTSWLSYSKFTVLGGFMLLLAGLLAIACFLNAAEEAEKGARYESGWKILFTSFAVTLVAQYLLAFLTPYALGTLMFLTDWWWAVLLAVLACAGGGGTAIYDRDGYRIGTFYD
jgi:hypothetical protein